MSGKFGEKLRKMRTGKNQTLEELAASIGSSKAYVWQLENKTNAKPSADLLLKIADHFNESPAFFLDDTRDEPSDDQRGESFFRKFQSLTSAEKRMIERVMAGLDDKE